MAKVFGWLGATAFGGPAAHVALMRSELVDRRAWVDEATFIDLRYGIVPAIAALLVHATWKLGRTAAVSILAAVVAVAATVAYLADVHELLILASGACLSAGWHHRGRALEGPALVAPWLLNAPGPDRPEGTTLLSLFAGFVRIGALLFGSGYVLVAFLRAEYVERLGVIMPAQLVDAVVIGQVTPGPVFTTATVIGYLLHGAAGAVVATVGIFLPAFVIVLALGRWIGPFLARPSVRPALTGLNAASVGLIAGVAVSLTDEGVVDVATGLGAVVALAVLQRHPPQPHVGGRRRCR
ncbi:MAG: chromate transporter, partial [Gemmatimonadaceae bacterium]|nr:chromate transporter [Gemmatimonadaceae bacterium]